MTSFICSSCGKIGERFNACSRCRLFRYCSKECQVNDWKGGHKRFCKDLVAAEQESATRVLPSEFLPFATPWSKQLIGRVVLKNYLHEIRFQELFPEDDPVRRAIAGTALGPQDYECTNASDAITSIMSRIELFLKMFYAHAKTVMKAKKPGHRGGFILMEAHQMTLKELTDPVAGPNQSRDLMLHYFSYSEVVFYLKEFCAAKSISLDNLLVMLRLSEVTAAEGGIPILTCFRSGFATAAGTSAPSGDIEEIDLGMIPDAEGDSDFSFYDMAQSIYSSAGHGINNAQSAHIDLHSGQVVAFEMEPTASYRPSAGLPAAVSSSTVPGADALQDFIARNCIYFWNFADAKFKAEGKGVLFVLSRNCRRDLYIDQSVHPEIRSADRQMLLVWATISNPDPLRTVKHLTKNITAAGFDAYSVSKVIKEYGSADTCPMAIITDPSGEQLPDEYRNGLETPTQNSEQECDCLLSVYTIYTPVLGAVTYDSDLGGIILNIDRD